MEMKKTHRGFGYYEFRDHYNSKCSLQKSSLAFYDCIWFGIDDCKPKIMACQAEDLGIKTRETTGWVEFPVPEEVNFTTRMHLDQDQVKDLIPILQKFVETGEID